MTKGQAYYETAVTNIKATGWPHWKAVGEAHQVRPTTAVGVARKYALRNGLPWPLKIHTVDQKRFKKGEEIFETLIADPTRPMSSFQDKNAAIRLLHYYLKHGDPKPWPIPGRTKGACSGRARRNGINRLELGERIYRILLANPKQPLRVVADKLGVSKNKANNDLAHYVRMKRPDPWPIPGRS